MPKIDSPIGIFDSGMGGVSVLAESIRLLVNEKFIYIGDSLNAPYGTKTVQEIENLSIGICDDLVNRDVKAIVVACNTATSASVGILRAKYKIPVIGMEPALKPAVIENMGGNIAVLATDVTLREVKFAKLSERFGSSANILSIPAPSLVEIVEKGILEGEEAEKAVAEVFKDVDIKKLSAVVLGCTHFVFLRETVKKVLGSKVKIYDGNEGTVRQLARLLSAENMLKVETELQEGDPNKDMPLVTNWALEKATIENTLSEEMVQRSRSLASYYLMNLDNRESEAAMEEAVDENQEELKLLVEEYLLEILDANKLNENEEKLLRFRYGLENVNRASFDELMKLMKIRKADDLKKSIASLDRKLFNYIKNRV